MKTILLTTTLVAVSFGIASAGKKGPLPHSYNFLDFGYERTSFDGAAFDDANGVAVDVMASPGKDIILAAEYHYARPDVGGDRVNTHDLKLGFGGFVPLGGSISFYTHLGGRYVRANTGIAEFSASDWGFYVEPGLRWSVGEPFEVYGAVEYSRILDDDIFGGKIGGVYYFSPTLGIEAFGRFGDDWATSYGIGLRIGW